MRRIVEGNTQSLGDVKKFIELVESRADFFGEGEDIFIARAPARLDVMGGIADYSGSLVLEMPIAEATLVAVQPSKERRIEIISLINDSGRALRFEMPLSEFGTVERPVDYDDIRNIFAKDRWNRWAAYIAGVFAVLIGEKKYEFQRGCRVLVYSDVPIGKGVSSSAALEVASMQAVCAASEIDIEPRELALLCQKVENLIVGAPCGVMDQITSHCGIENCLVSLLCQPADIKEITKIPEEIGMWGIDSGVRHTVSGSDYTRVRVGAFMGYRIIAEMAGLEARRTVNGTVAISDPRWHGYLANLSPSEYEDQFASGLPREMNGKEFIERYDGVIDRVTKIEPDITYPVRGPTEFPIYENSRVARFCEMLKASNANEHLRSLGGLMFDSHAGYAACGLTEPGTNRLVEFVRQNRGNGLFGARITGGGSGGTVAIVGERDCGPVVAEISIKYQKETGRAAHVFAGSSPGCATFGFIRLGRSDTNFASTGHNLL